MAVLKHQVQRVTFARIWEHYPRFPPCLDKDGNVPKGWENQCAIRVGVALERSGVSFESLSRGGRCPRTLETGGMIGSAAKLAQWLNDRPFPECGRTQKMPGSVWEGMLKGKTGIVFFENYWRRHGETHGFGSGDHIDLWNKDTLSPGLASFLRFSLGISQVPNVNLFTRRPDNENWYSDLSKSSQVRFWHIL